MQIGKLRPRRFSSKVSRSADFVPKKSFQNLFPWSVRILFSHILDVDGAGMQSCTGAMLVGETDLFILVSPALGTKPEAHKGPFIIP